MNYLKSIVVLLASATLASSQHTGFSISIPGCSSRQACGRSSSRDTTYSTGNDQDRHTQADSCDQTSSWASTPAAWTIVRLRRF
jgi:hypothetical protein